MSTQLTPLKAIRSNCLICSCFSPQEVKLCPMLDCPLYPYRFGHNPSRAGLGGNFARKSLSESSDSTRNEALND